MSFFEIATALIVLTALFSLINARLLKLPTTIGVTLMAMLTSFAIVMVGQTNAEFRDEAAHLLAQIDFNKLVLHGLLAFLLFAGSLHLELDELAREWRPISLLAVFGTAISTVAVAGAMHAALGWMGMPVSWIACFLFGALISPTDPIAVLGILKRAKTPKSLETQMAGESLFNDGVGVVFFLTVLATAGGGQTPRAIDVLALLLRQTGGGVALGLILGFIACQLLKRVAHYQVEVLMTLALAMGTYAAGERLGVSAPIAVIVAGLLIGNRGRLSGMSAASQEHLSTFWELIDDILNAVLFVLMGLELLIIPYRGTLLLAGIVATAATLLVRWASVAGIIKLTGFQRDYCKGTITVLSWGGLRGALSLAMALALPMDEHRNLILAMTYTVVVFSVLVQGLTFGAVVKRSTGEK